MNRSVRAAASVLAVVMLTISGVVLIDDSDVDATTDYQVTIEYDEVSVVSVANGGTLTINLLELTAITCMMPTASYPVVVSWDLPVWVHYLDCANMRVFAQCIPTETGTFTFSIDYHPNASNAEVKTWSCTVVVVDPYLVEDASATSPLNAIPVECTYKYDGDQLVIYFDGVDVSSMTDPYFYIAVYTGDVESCRYYLSPSSNATYTVNLLEDSLTGFIVYLCEGLPGDYSASTIVSSATCLGSQVFSSVSKSDSDSSGSGSGSSGFELIDTITSDPASLLSYGIMAIAALFVVGIIFGRRNR